MALKLVGLTQQTEPVTINGDDSVAKQAAIVKAFFNNPDISPAQKMELIRRHEARNSLLNFITYTKPDYQVNWHHDVICNEIDDFLRSPTRNRLMIFVGPRRGKSEIISRRLVAYAFGKNPNLNVVACSYGADLAKKMSRDTQRIIDSDSYRELFPETRLSSKFVKTSARGRNFIRTSDQFEIVDHNGSYKAAGVEGSITGTGADLAIIDDPIKDWKEALSTQKKQSVYDWYTSTFYTRGSKMGKIIILMTRWSDDDLCGKLLSEAKADPEKDQWEVISFPEIFDENSEYIHPCDDRKPGEVLWAEMFDAKRVAKIRATVGTKVWESLFQQNPKPGDGTAFKISWFKYYKEMPTFDRIVTSWDFNFGSNKETADFVVGTVWGLKGADKYLIYMTRDRLTFTESLLEIIRVHNLFPNAVYTVIEGKANGTAITDVVKSKIPGVVVFIPTSSKVTRALAASPQFEAGNIYFPDMYYRPNRQNHVWAIKLMPLLIEEFKAFPAVANDDMVDSTVQMILRELDTPAWLSNAQPTTEQKADEPTAHDRAVAAILGINLSNEVYDPASGSMGVTWKLGF